jgi:3-phenylpropionate/trans-cinnamate dioxygenase ferredoxin component
VVWVDVGREQPEPGEEVRSIRHDERYLAVASVDGTWYGFADVCTHDECPLADGILRASSIECGCHGSVFDVRTGAVMRGPANEPIAVYPTEVRAGRVWIQVSVEH